MKFCSLFSGSSGNSLYVSSGDTGILIDAGLTGKAITAAMDSIGENPAEVQAILITHEHSDHTIGAGILSRKFDIPVYANEKTWEAMERSLGKIAVHNRRIITGETSVGDLHVSTFRVPHDSAGCIGYTLEDKDGRLFSSVTDMGVFTEEIRRGIRDSDIILIESNHDVEMLKYGPYPYELKRRVMSELGHLSNEDCAAAILSILNNNHRKIILGHLSRTNNVPELAYKTVENILMAAGVEIGEDADLELKLASRIRPSAYTQIK